MTAYKMKGNCIRQNLFWHITTLILITAVLYSAPSRKFTQERSQPNLSQTTLEKVVEQRCRCVVPGLVQPYIRDFKCLPGPRLQPETQCQSISPTSQSEDLKEELQQKSS